MPDRQAERLRVEGVLEIGLRDQLKHDVIPAASAMAPFGGTRDEYRDWFAPPSPPLRGASERMLRGILRKTPCSKEERRKHDSGILSMGLSGRTIQLTTKNRQKHSQPHNAYAKPARPQRGLLALSPCLADL